MGAENNKLIQQHKNPALAINLAMSNWVNRMTQSGRVNESQAHRMEGRSEAHGLPRRVRILNTPSLAHAIHVRQQTLLIYLITLPLVLIPLLSSPDPHDLLHRLGAPWDRRGRCWIEDPFGHDPNDLPLTKICNVIERDVVSTLSFEKPLSEQEEVEIGDADESGVLDAEDEGFNLLRSRA